MSQGGLATIERATVRRIGVGLPLRPTITCEVRTTWLFRMNSRLWSGTLITTYRLSKSFGSQRHRSRFARICWILEVTGTLSSDSMSEFTIPLGVSPLRIWYRLTAFSNCAEVGLSTACSVESSIARRAYNAAAL